MSKALLACGFLAAAFHSYSVGEIRSANNGNPVADLSVYQPLLVKEWRDRLTAAMEQGAADESKSLQQRLALRAPLDPLAFEVALVQAIQMGEEIGAENLARDVVSRQPRSLSARLFLLSRAAQRGSYGDVLLHFERLAVLRSVDQTALVDAIIGVFRDGEDWTLLLRYVRQGRPLSKELIRDLMSEPVETFEMEPLVADDPRLQSDYLRRLLRESGHDEAYAAWLRFRRSADPVAEAPFNSRFLPDEAAVPYNWFVDSRHAEIQTSGGLYVTYRGVERPLIARQYFSAPGGVYQLVAEARGRMPEKGGSLEWSMSCAEPKTRLATMAVELNKRGEMETFETEVTIPVEDCAFQVIELWGRSGAFPKTSRTEFLSILLDPQTE